jgi:NADH:ubiquinone oxidoreductase subunit E
MRKTLCALTLIIGFAVVGCGTKSEEADALAPMSKNSSSDLQGSIESTPAAGSADPLPGTREGRYYLRAGSIHRPRTVVLRYSQRMSEPIQIGGTRPRPPLAEEITLRFSQEGVHELEALKSHYPTLKACILPGLWLAQREYGGFLSGDAISELAYRLNRSIAEVEGVATFYSMYNAAHEPGRHKIELCTCLSCSVNDAYPLRDYIVQKLGVRHGETTEDGLFTFEEVECLNACDRAPVVQVGDQYFGPVDRTFIDSLIEKLRATEESTVIQLADTIVKAQIGKAERFAGSPPKESAAIPDSTSTGR